MRRRPFTLLGRTALALGALLIVSLVLWMASAIVFLIAPIKQVQLGNISAVVILARDLVLAHPEKEHIPLFDNYRIVTDAADKPSLTAETAGYVPDLQTHLRKIIGPETLVYREYKENTLWIRFVANDRVYWAIIPKALPPLPAYILATISIVIAASLLGAYFIIYSTTRELRKVTSAVCSFGRGEVEAMLEEKGPREIRDLSKGFNQMAIDLRKLDDDRRLMLAGISHDLRTPLTRLRIAVELVATRAKPEIANGIIHDIEDMDGILKQFLDYVRDGTEEPLSIQDLGVLVKEVCGRYQTRGVDMKVELSEIPSFAFRKLAITRAVANVIENAVRYGRSGIEVLTRIENGAAEIIVLDKGPGIRVGNPMDYIKAFARENTARSETGSGLGLTIVSRIINTHAGSVYVENRNPVGFSVKLRLPIRSA